MRVSILGLLRVWSLATISLSWLFHRPSWMVKERSPRRGYPRDATHVMERALRLPARFDIREREQLRHRAAQAELNKHHLRQRRFLFSPRRPARRQCCTAPLGAALEMRAACPNAHCLSRPAQIAVSALVRPSCPPSALSNNRCRGTQRTTISRGSQASPGTEANSAACRSCSRAAAMRVLTCPACRSSRYWPAAAAAAA